MRGSALSPSPLTPQRKRGVSLLAGERPLNLVHKVLDDISARVGFVSPPNPDAAYLFQGFLRPEVRYPDYENNSIDEFESVIQHQPLQFSIVFSAPENAGQESPSDLNRALLRIKSKVT